jgi:hypothetical protein
VVQAIDGIGWAAHEGQSAVIGGTFVSGPASSVIAATI